MNIIFVNNKSYKSPPNKVVLIVIITAPAQIKMKIVVKTLVADLDSVTINILRDKRNTNKEE